MWAPCCRWAPCWARARPPCGMAPTSSTGDRGHTAHTQREHAFAAQAQASTYQPTTYYLLLTTYYLLLTTYYLLLQAQASTYQFRNASTDIPTDKQMLFAIRLARDCNLGLPAEVATSYLLLIGHCLLDSLVHTASTYLCILLLIDHCLLDTAYLIAYLLLLA